MTEEDLKDIIKNLKIKEDKEEEEEDFDPMKTMEDMDLEDIFKPEALPYLEDILKENERAHALKKE